MRNLIKLVMTMSMVAGLASPAMGDDKAKAPTPAPAAKTPTPAAKAPTPAPTPAPSKPAPPAPGPKAPPTDKAPAPAAMEAPKPAPELTAAAKAVAGNWKCKGTMMTPGGEQPMKATMKIKLALDGFWAQTSFSELKKGGFKFESFRTFDGKKWHSLMVDNMGSQEVGVSDGPKDGKTVWETTSRSAMGDAKARHYEEMAGKEMKMWGEWSMDKGKTWVKGYEATCTK